MNKISICTTCMGRAAHIKKTLLRNIKENPGEDIEFILLDYNSPDDLTEYIRDHCVEHIQTGKLKYYKTYEPKYFNLSHAKNLVCKLAGAEIICMVDADNYAGKGYADRVKEIFAANGMNTIITTLRRDHIPYRDQGGKLCFAKNLFYRVNGFDESLSGYGMDDVDLVNRMERAGGTRMFIEERKFLRYIDHTNLERIRHHHLMNNIKDIFVQTKSTWDYPVLYLLKDGTYMLIPYYFDEEKRDEQIETFGGWRIKDNKVERGKYKTARGKLQLQPDETKEPAIYMKKDKEYLLQDKGEEEWQRIKKRGRHYQNIIISAGECMNRIKCAENCSGDHRINETGWGKATVYVNFDSASAIIVQ
jgi:glycosyltransferase involved in cell wall biosynthesis